MCCDLLIYDRDNSDLSQADDIFDIAASESKVLISFAAYGDHVYLLDADGNAVAMLYDAGAADGYIGYAETLRFLDRRLDKTEVKQISIGKNDNIPLFYCDMAGISADVPDNRTGLCMDLIEIMTDTEVMKRVSVKDGSPQYLMFSRISFYDDLEKEYPMYAGLRKIADNDNNRLFRAYGSFMEETYGR